MSKDIEACMHAKDSNSFPGLREEDLFVKNGCFGMQQYSTKLIYDM